MLAFLGGMAAFGQLIPNGILQYSFPELPPTLRTQSKGEAHVPMLTATFPGNYTREGKFPLFVYIPGGDGGFGELVDLGRAIAGGRDFICVTMPLFKARFDPAGPARGLMILRDDYAVLTSSYRTMLERLAAEVPNIDWERSVFGGHSNGAHTTGVLLSGKDPYLLQKFSAFYLHEGGLHLINDETARELAGRGKRLLAMFGDRPMGNPPRESPMLGILRRYEQTAAAAKLSFTARTMKGYGHQQPEEYMRQIGQWARGEQIVEVIGR